ncbi:MAG: multidrug efflux MFS transporter [Eubacterium sp.]|nr:multidrug efflux MFS transporter [Eubacterium sp.]
MKKDTAMNETDLEREMQKELNAPDEKPDKKTVIILAVMLFGTFIAMLNQTVISPALPKIMEGLGIDANQGQLLTTVFSLVTGIMVPTTAFLFGRFKIRSLFITAMGVFTAGSFLAGFANSYALLFTARILQALGVGVLMSMIQFVIMRTFPEKKRGVAMGIVGIVCAAAPAVGPVLAGIIVDKLGWNAVFLVIGPLALIDFLLAIFLMRDPEQIKPDKGMKLDFISVLLSVVGFGGPLYCFSNATLLGWTNPLVLGSLIIGVVCLILFALRQIKAPKPFLSLKVLGYRDFTISMIIGLILNAALLALMTILPIYMQTIRDFSALYTGAMMVPGALIMALFSPIAGKIYDKSGPRMLTLVGLAIFTATIVGFAMMNLSTGFPYICAMYTLWMFSLALLIMPLTTWGLNALPPELMAHGTALYNTIKTIAGALGTAILVLIMTAVTAGSAAPDTAEAAMSGVRTSFIVSVVIAVFALALGVLFVRRQKEKQAAG